MKKFPMTPSLVDSIDFRDFHDKYKSIEWNAAKKYAKDCQLKVTKEGIYLQAELQHYVDVKYLPTLSPLILIENNGFDISTPARHRHEFEDGKMMESFTVYGFIVTQETSHICFGQPYERLMRKGGWTLKCRGHLRILFKY